MRALVVTAGLLAGCTSQASTPQERDTASAEKASPEQGIVTLYRNSPLLNELRLHWATFDAADGPDYNLGNCQMAVRILNANLRASAEAEGRQPFPNVGFWCEVGSYSEAGGVPIKFDSEFPSDTTSPIRFSE